MADARSLVGLLALFVGFVCAALLQASAARAAADVKINHAAAGAVAAYAVCTPQPNGDERCETFVVQYTDSGKDTRDGEARSVTALAFNHFAAFIHPDGTEDEFVAEFGFSTDVSGFHDRARLTSARVGGVTLDLYDIDPATGEPVPNGRTATLGPFEWTAASGIYVFGSDGPFGFGLPRLLVDRCVTQIENAHERFSTAHVTGTINGVSVDAYGPAYLPWPGTGPEDARGAIYDNRFTVLVASHAPSCQEGSAR